MSSRVTPAVARFSFSAPPALSANPPLIAAFALVTAATACAAPSLFRWFGGCPAPSRRSHRLHGASQVAVELDDGDTDDALRRLPMRPAVLNATRVGQSNDQEMSARHRCRCHAFGNAITRGLAGRIDGVRTRGRLIDPV